MMSRRQCLQLGGFALGAAVVPGLANPGPGMAHMPCTGEAIPRIGLGSWITLDVADPSARAPARTVVDGFLAGGGSMIDSSPMYGHAQAVIGEGLAASAHRDSVFSATKVWVRGQTAGEFQMEQALKLWGVERLDLVHVHNMVDWETHLPWLQAWRDAGRIRYLGISTSHGRRHGPLSRVIREQPFEVVQFTYNIADREAEQQLLPLSADHGRAVVINRPFQGGYLFRRVAGVPLPDWAGEFGIANWAQFFLKFVVSHPAVTCAIPATSRTDHLAENLGALNGPLPDVDARAAMIEWFDRHAA